MKKIILLFPIVILFTCFKAYAQNRVITDVNSNNLPIIYVNNIIDTHIIAPEKITYIDISNDKILGDIPQYNTARIRPEENQNGIITIMTEKYLIQYMLIYSNDMNKVCSRYNIPYTDISSHINPEYPMSKDQLYNYCYSMISENRSLYNIDISENGIYMYINNIYTMDKYYFIDVTIQNKTNIMYSIDDITFRLSDKKQIKSTNYQDIKLTPIFTFQNKKTFKKNYRNIFVFEKFTYPNEKIFNIRLDEKQISGRQVILPVEYSDILNADIYINN